MGSVPITPLWQEFGNSLWREPSPPPKPLSPYSFRHMQPPPVQRGIGLTEQIPGGNPEAGTPLDAIFGLGLSGLGAYAAQRKAFPKQRSFPEITEEPSAGGTGRREFLKKFAGAGLGMVAAKMGVPASAAGAPAPAAAAVPPIEFVPYGYKYGLLVPKIPKNHPWAKDFPAYVDGSPGTKVFQPSANAGLTEKYPNGIPFEALSDKELDPKHPINVMWQDAYKKQEQRWELERLANDRMWKARDLKEKNAKLTEQAESGFKAPEDAMSGPGRPMRKLTQKEKQKMGYKKGYDYDRERETDRHERKLSKEELDALVKAMMAAAPGGDPTMGMLGAPVNYGGRK